MDKSTVQRLAWLRVCERQDIRRGRGLALAALLAGDNIDSSLIEPLDRQRVRAQLLSGEGVKDDVGSEGGSRKLFEAIIQGNTFLPSRFLALGAIAALPVGRVVVRNPSGSAEFGTGALVGNGLLLTNNHVLQSKEEASRGAVQLGYYATASGTGPGAAQEFEFRPDELFITDENLDFSLVAVASENGAASIADYGSLKLIAQSGKALVGESVNIIQHPEGGPQQVVIRQNMLVDVVDQYVHYQTDTAPGSSGSPVFNDDWQLVALHHAAVPSPKDDKSTINEGIRISCILEKLRGVSQSSGLSTTT